MKIQTIDVIIKMGINEIINAIVIPKNKICYVNDKKYSVDDEFLKDLVRTIAVWDNEYGNDNNIDSEEFRVIVHTTKGREIFHGKGVYPHNYEHLKEILGGLK